MRHALLTSLLVVLTACGPSSVEDLDLATSAAEIVGGTVAERDPAVVALVAYGSQYCSGTLIAPRTVLTAAHCIRQHRTGVYQVRFGTRVSAPFLAIPVEAQLAHPGYASGSFANDIGLLRLAQAAGDVQPLPPNDTPLTDDDVGRPIRHVGYGATSGQGGGNGTRRETTYALREVRETIIESGGMGTQTCSGDSGGPAFMRLGEFSGERVAGVVSYGDSNCASFGADTRVDAFLGSWVAPTFEAWDPPSCGLDARCLEGCGDPDPDCLCFGDGQCNPLCPRSEWDPDCAPECAEDGVCSPAFCAQPDPDCVSPGGACVGPGDCEGGLCAERPEGAYCSRPCGGGCPGGMRCGADDLCYLEQDAVKLELAVTSYRTEGCAAAGGSAGLLGLILLSLAGARRRSQSPPAQASASGNEKSAARDLRAALFFRLFSGC